MDSGRLLYAAVGKELQCASESPSSAWIEPWPDRRAAADCNQEQPVHKPDPTNRAPDVDHRWVAARKYSTIASRLLLKVANG